jgi:hypothetical protein
MNGSDDAIRTAVLVALIACTLAYCLVPAVAYLAGGWWRRQRARARGLRLAQERPQRVVRLQRTASDAPAVHGLRENRPRMERVK